MKKATAPVLVLAVILLQGISLSAQKKKDPVFTIIQSSRDRHLVNHYRSMSQPDTGHVPYGTQDITAD